MEKRTNLLPHRYHITHARKTPTKVLTADSKPLTHIKNPYYYDVQEQTAYKLEQLITILITLDYTQLYFCPEPISGPTRPQIQLLQQQIQEPPFYNSISATSRSLLYSTPTHYNYNYNYIHNYNPLYAAYNKSYSSYLGGSGSQLGYNYTPGGRSYRFYKYGLGNSSYNGYYSLSYGESYCPNGTGAAHYGGRLSPAAAHTAPLLATSATGTGPGNGSNSWLKLPTAPLPLLPSLDDDLQVNTEPYLSSYCSRPIDYLPSPAASLRSDSYAYRRPRRESNYYKDPYYPRYSRTRGFGFLSSERERDLECDRLRVRSRNRANSLQHNPTFIRSPLLTSGRLSADCVSSSPRRLRRDQDYLRSSVSPQHSFKTSPQHQEGTQYHPQSHLTSRYHHNPNTQSTTHSHHHHTQHSIRSPTQQTAYSTETLQPPIQPIQPHNSVTTGSDRLYYNTTATTTTASLDTFNTSTISNTASASTLLRHQHSLGTRHDGSCEEFSHIPGNLNCFARKRMMVSKLWKGCFPDITPEHVHRHNFYLCQWQRNTQVRIVYLFYRWLTAITCLAAFVCSLLDIGRTEEHFENHYAKWWIYLTHWALLFCTLQAWLAAWIVTQGMMVEREDFELMRRAKKSRLHHIYWVLYTCATVYAFVVTTMYWGLVYDPEVHKIDTLNIMVHVLNSVIMLIDLAIVGHPIKLSHVYFTCGIGLAYGIFSGIYFLAGGTDRKNQVAIYPTMDWTKPGKAIITTVCSIIFVFIIHFTCFLMYRARVWLFTKLCIRSSNRCDGEMGDGLNDDSCARLGGGSSADYSHQQQYPTVHSEQPHRSHHTLSSSTTTIQCTAEHVYSTAPAHGVHQHKQQPLQATQQQQQQQHQHGTHKTHHQHQYSTHHQYPPQYAGYQQQPVVAGVNVGVISTAEIYQPQDNKNKHQIAIGTGSSGVGGSGSGCGIGDSSVNNSSLSRTVAQLDATQREQFLNPNKIMEFKM